MSCVPLSLSHLLPPWHSLLLFYFVGYLGYAGSGKNSRGTQLIMAFQDNKYLGGTFLIYSFQRFSQRSQNFSFFTSSLISFLFPSSVIISFVLFFFLFSISYLLAPSLHIIFSLLFSSLLFSHLCLRTLQVDVFGKFLSAS